MTEEEFVQIMESDDIECKLHEIDDCNVVLGLQIMRKYLPKQGIDGAEHEVIFSASIRNIVAAGITKKDTIRLRELNWMLDEYSGENLACFV